MDAAQFKATVIDPCANVIPRLDSPKRRFMLAAIAGQESAWTYRIQKPVGYAHGFWQCERRGAVLGVLTGDSTAEMIAGVCTMEGVKPGLDDVFDAIIQNDRLAYAVAALTLWPDPEPLPAPPERDSMWEYYLRCWRPGRPDKARWNDVHSETLRAFSLVA